jgi:hypothetical protein
MDERAGLCSSAFFVARTSPPMDALKGPEIARRLVELADRAGRLMPLNHDPERFFVDRGEVEADLLKLAREVCPGADVARPARGRFEAGTIEAKGRVVVAAIRRSRKPARKPESRKARKLEPAA